MQTGCWEDLILRAEIINLSSMQAASIEKALHKWLDEHRIRGEWFKPMAIKGLFKAIEKNHNWQEKWIWHGEKKRPDEYHKGKGTGMLHKNAGAV